MEARNYEAREPGKAFNLWQSCLNPAKPIEQSNLPTCCKWALSGLGLGITRLDDEDNPDMFECGRCGELWRKVCP